ncbi:MAG TPA: hypothetical protein VEB68_13340 [Croceibacterium sp.]|nr:hypothetical protein [Croceibacterium sp.]
MGVEFSRTTRAAPRRAAMERNAHGLAHELANCIQVIGGNLELIAARTTDAQTLRYLENARAAAQQLAELTRRLNGEDG